MTAVEWLIEKIKNDHNNNALTGREWVKIFEQAKEMEKQQIIDAYANGSNDRLKNIVKDYYNETYGSKGSDETLKEYHIVDTNEMIDHIGEANEMVEISDEEINIGAINFCTKNIDTEVMHWSDIFEYACKWYREQLKQRQ